MQLSINAVTKQNPLLEKYSQIPLEKTDTDIILKNWHDMRGYGSISDTRICDINSFMGMVDTEEFAKITSLEYVRRFNEALETFNAHWGLSMRRWTSSDYPFETKLNFDWKPGVYDILKEYINYLNGLQMRNSGITTLFKRITNGRRAIRNLENSFVRLEGLRTEAKKNVGKVVDNVDEILEMQNNILSKLYKSTEEANQMTDSFHIHHGINYQACDLEPPFNGFLKLKLFTIVQVQPSMMNIVNSKNEMIEDLPTPLCYLVFVKDLSKVLLNKKTTDRLSYAAAVGGYHPYISTSRYYNLAVETSNYSQLTTSPWTTSLCLSSFTDDIMTPLDNHDYVSFIMGLSSWNSIYNNDSTTPHNPPAKIFYDTGIPSDKKDSELQAIKSLLGFNKDKCWEQNVKKHETVEDSAFLRQVNSTNFRINNTYDYGEFVVDECNKKQCPLRKECSSYKSYIQSYEEYPELNYMIESYIGYLCEYNSIYNDSSEEFILNKPIDLRASLIQRIDNFIFEKYKFSNMADTFDDINYWTESSGDVDEIKMERMVKNWTLSANNPR